MDKELIPSLVIKHLRDEQNLSNEEILKQILNEIVDHYQRGCQHCFNVLYSAIDIDLNGITNEAAK